MFYHYLLASDLFDFVWLSSCHLDIPGHVGEVMQRYTCFNLSL